MSGSAAESVGGSAVASGGSSGVGGGVAIITPGRVAAGVAVVCGVGAAAYLAYRLYANREAIAWRRTRRRQQATDSKVLYFIRHGGGFYIHKLAVQVASSLYKLAVQVASSLYKLACTSGMQLP